jgi:hypothetical protein
MRKSKGRQTHEGDAAAEAERTHWTKEEWEAAYHAEYTRSERRRVRITRLEKQVRGLKRTIAKLQNP